MVASIIVGGNHNRLLTGLATYGWGQSQHELELNWLPLH